MNRIRRPVAAAVVLALALLMTVSAAAQPMNFRARLTGGEEVPPVDTQAHGQAVFNLTKGTNGLRFTLVVVNIDDAVAAHIHCGAFGENGPVGVTLFSGGPTSANGVLAQGTITAPDAENACGWADLAAVVAAIQSGNTYVNVHTNANPGGEIRGQIR